MTETVIHEPSVNNVSTIFIDTCVLLPSSVWNLYRHHLSKFKSENPNALSLNTTIDKSALSSAKKDLESIVGFCSSLGKPCITEGVHEQVVSKVTQICQNIKERSSNFAFSTFNKLIHTNLREDGSEVYSELQDISSHLESVRAFTSEHIWRQPLEKSYFLLETFVRTLSLFFDIGKENHTFDFYTDEGIVAGSLYQSLVQKEKTIVVSRDKDILEFLGFSEAIIEKLKPLLKRDPHFEFFYANPPSFHHYPGNSDDLNESRSKFLDRTMNLSGYNNRIPENQVQEYHARVGNFSNSLLGIMERFISSLNK
jgi:hypothetical protein